MEDAFLIFSRRTNRLLRHCRTVQVLLVRDFHHHQTLLLPPNICTFNRKYSCKYVLPDVHVMVSTMIRDFDMKYKMKKYKMKKKV